MRTFADKLATKMSRMAPEGYYVVYWGVADRDLSQPQQFSVQHIKGGKAAYVHFLGIASDYSWATLQWNCALTKTKLERQQKAAPTELIERSIYFATHADLLKFPYINCCPAALIPSPLDDQRRQKTQ